MCIIYDMCANISDVYILGIHLIFTINIGLFPRKIMRFSVEKVEDIPSKYIQENLKSLLCKI